MYTFCSYTEGARTLCLRKVEANLKQIHLHSGNEDFIISIFGFLDYLQFFFFFFTRYLHIYT